MVPEVCEWLTRAGRVIIPFEIHHAQGERQNSRILDAFREESDRMHVLFSVNMLIEGLHVEGVDAVLFLRRTESYIVTLQQLGRCLDAGAGKQPVVLDFVNNLSGKSVYDVMAPHLERLSLLPSPKGFEGNTSFLTTGFLSDIRLRIEEILAELEPGRLCMRGLLNSVGKKTTGRQLRKENSVCGATPNALPINGENYRRNDAASWNQSASNGICLTPNG